MTRQTVIGWHGHPVDDVQEAGGWAWLRLNELVWRRPARRVVRALARWMDGRNRD